MILIFYRKCSQMETKKLKISKMRQNKTQSKKRKNRHL